MNVIHDGMMVFVAIGGIMALMLGFSLLSALLDCLDIVAKITGHDEALKSSFFRRTLRQ